MHRSAVISGCQRYRYALRRRWADGLPTVLFIALNPSTADGVMDDPTVRRCIGFARGWGFGSLTVANLFALRATNPQMLRSSQDPIGPRNNGWLRRLSTSAELTVVAWGAHGQLHDRAATVLPVLRAPHHLGLTRDGHPRHPLYVRSDTRPVLFQR